MTAAAAKSLLSTRESRARDALKHPGRAPAAAPLVALQSMGGNRATSDLVGIGTQLSADVRADMERRFGQDFSNVHVHDDASAHESAQSFAAKAYTHGEHIVFADGRFAPETQQGRHLLAHELAHVVQQRRGGAQPSGDARAATERAAGSAADAVTGGSGPVAVGGATGVGVACEKDEEEDEKQKGQASTTVLAQKRLRVEHKEQHIGVEDVHSKAKGTGGEVQVPSHLYSGKDWNNIGGGSETASSRQSLARRSAVNDRYKMKEGTSGIDFLVEHIPTGRLVIGEQKAADSTEFPGGTAIAQYLEVNVKHAADVLRQRIKDGKVPKSEIPRLERTISRLDATAKALAHPTNETKLPEGVVFEFTNVGGKSETIGNQHIEALAERYGKTPGFIDHLLSRTFVRDPALAQKRRRATGKAPSEIDPDIVPANDLLNDPAKKTLEGLHEGKTVPEIKKERDAEKARKKVEDAKAKKQAELDAAQAVQVEKDARIDAKKQQKADVKRVGDEAREKYLADERARRKAAGEPEPKTVRARDAERVKANKAARQASAQHVEDQDQAARDAAAKKTAEDAPRKEAEAKQKAENAARKEQSDKEAKELADALKLVDIDKSKPTDWDRPPKEQLDPKNKAYNPEAVAREKIKAAAAKDPKLGAKLNEKVNANQTQDFNDYAKRNNAEVDVHNAEIDARNAKRPTTEGDEKMSGAAHELNEAAAGLRALDAFLDARDHNKGYGEAVFDAGNTYLDNTNQLMGGIATFQGRMKTEKGPNGKEQQYYGNDAGDAFFGTAGENIANYIVPGKGWDQFVNGAANFIDAGDDHLNRGQPVDPTKATVRTGTDLLAELTPSRMFATTIGAGARAYWDLHRTLHGDFTGVDKFGDDAVRGKLGSIIQPAAMWYDFWGNLGGNSPGAALDKTLKKGEESTLGKVGNWGGASAADLGENKEAKQGKYGFSVQTSAAFLGFTNALAREEGLSRALDETVESTKGTLLGDATAATVTEGREIYKEGKELGAKGKEILNDEYQAKKKLVYGYLGL